MHMSIRDRLKRITLLKILVVIWRVFRNRHGFFAKIRALGSFFESWSAFRHMPRNSAFLLKTHDLYPRLFDNTHGTPIDPVYFYQDTWCAGKIFSQKPEHHYDIASEAEFIGIISQFVPTTMVDIRPLPVTLPNLSFMQGDTTRLPFDDSSIASLSSICVIEHIGLGRYGDPLDPFGSEKALAEMIRVLAPGGSLYISVPIDAENKVYFNAHRAFSPNYIFKLCMPLTLIEERYVYGNRMEQTYDPKKGFGTGLYHFKK
ncbi:MAG: DUF268 domain-containing protein [Candidatus Sungbacteria bacterium]|nr:DUF268 domain-containing protein [Candidatus Sungbacteria bacterium]